MNKNRNPLTIGDYVKYDNSLWEIIDINNLNPKEIYYRLSCRSFDIAEPIWVMDNQIEETDLSQSYFEL
jgi:hypothetical protein